MSILQSLSIKSIRNIQQADLKLSSGVNLLHGENGSGKTSVLESIHLLATGRSFRTSKPGTLISETESSALVVADLSNGHQIGLTRSRQKGHQLNMDTEKQRNWDKVARELPVQVLDANSFLLLDGGPNARRRFLDWGVFHVEPLFVDQWRKTRKCIANRNLLLRKSSPDTDQLRAWDLQLCKAASDVDMARNSYFNCFVPIFDQVYESLTGPSPHVLNLIYHRGWDSDRELAEVLLHSEITDKKHGATQNGPHRADLVVKAGSRLAIETLSRGQQKILVSALKIAQGVLLSQALDRACIYLVDDLPAELDRANRQKVLDKLMGLKGQLFVTCVDREALLISSANSPKMTTFHVKRGTITT
jgi:DNA replication and repair protein RecF